MAFLDSVLSDRDRREHARLKDFKSQHPMHAAGVSPEIREHVANMERSVGNALRAGVSEFVNADPNLSALADEMVREAVRNAKHP